jgi:enterobactin synthetase component D / holo-[acyl-carrier protein] synthase
MPGPLLAAVTSGNVVVRERRVDVADADLPLAERAAIANAVPSRRREFATTRRCARDALAELGFPVDALLRDEHGMPAWPTGVVGALTHCEGYRGAAVAERRRVLTLGVDAEIDAPLPEGVLEAVATPSEMKRLARLPDWGVCWPRLLFSAKESLYKAWYPLARRWLDFDDAQMTVDPDGGFHAHVLVNGPLRDVAGRWVARDGILVTGVEVPAPE